MRALAVFGLIILIASVILVTLSTVNYAGIRDTIYAGIQGTVLQPSHDWIVNSWVAVGNMGFTYIAATILGIAIGGGLFLTIIIYGLFWQKLVQGKILHKTVPATTPLASMQRTLSTSIQPELATTPVSEPKKEEE